MFISRALADDVIPLRHAVLRAGLPRHTAIFPGDDALTTRHFVARSEDGAIVGVATLHLNLWEGEVAWQLRGMAIEPSHQRSGIGDALLRAAEQSALDEDSPTRLLWCNARTPAAGFYEKHGWRVMSEPFEVPTAGPHVKMLKRV